MHERHNIAQSTRNLLPGMPRLQRYDCHAGPPIVGFSEIRQAEIEARHNNDNTNFMTILDSHRLEEVSALGAGAHLSAQTASIWQKSIIRCKQGVYAIGVLPGRKQRPEVMTYCDALHTLIMMKLAMLALAS